MSESKDIKKSAPNVIPGSIVDLLIADAFNKNGIQPDQKKPLSNEQKAMIRNLIEDLTKQVNDFVQNTNNKNNK